ncbi:Uu.00g016460.m01.CDS01 [Anthostomella pinea]|uniref:Uu.00g016460.m01.CDS01 n=1 Tax=Anthostomella pinea TaxID=933095 RepID=A0AAI8VYR3_9PEZI|nr:Uu.00g016460.m01.CDS01 [Anthostomella pinea]
MPTLAVDYAKSFDEVYCAGTLEAIRQEAGADTFPSWVPRWDRSLARDAGDATRMITDCAADDTRSVSAHTLSANFTSAQQRILWVDGIVLEPILAVNDVVLASMYYPDIAAFLARSKRFADAHHHDWESTTSDLDDLLTTMMCDPPGTTKFQDPRKNNELIELFCIADTDAAQVTETFTRLSASCQSVLSTMLNTCYNRRLFITASGRLGLGPQNSRAGDLIAVFLGERFPYVVRPVDGDPCKEGDENSHEQGYRMLEHCYVHGIMNGEAVQEHEAAGKPIPTFRLA